MKPTPELFEIIKQNFSEPDAFNIDDIEVFDFLLCDTSYNKSWMMKLSPEFVRGYANKANEGEVAITAMHSKDKLAFGRTIKGHGFYSNEGAYAKLYLMRGFNIGNGITSDDIIKSIKARTNSDGSIEFYPGQTICSICGNDFFSEKCMHYPGISYDDEMCYTIVTDKDAVYSNYSIVPDGSIEAAKRLSNPMSFVDIPEKGKFNVFSSVNFEVKGEYINKLSIKKQKEDEVQMDEKQITELLQSVKDLAEANDRIKLSIDRNKELEDAMEVLKVQHGEELGAKQEEIDNLMDEIELLKKFKEAYFNVLGEEHVRAYGKEIDIKSFESIDVESLENKRLEFIQMSVGNTNEGNISPEKNKFPIDESLYQMG